MAELGVFGVGVATADAELRTVGEKNTSVCSVNLAFNRSYRTKNDTYEKEVCFLRAQIWGARAEKMADEVKKGQPIHVTGYMKQDTWEDRDTGQKRVSFSLSIRDFQLCVKQAKKKVNDDPQPANATASPADSSDNDDDDIPF